MEYGTTTCTVSNTDLRDMYTFNADRIASYELGSEEPTTVAVNNINLFTQSADDILSRMGKVIIPLTDSNGSWSYCVYHCLRGWGS